jgi:ubiquinone/menaquinone biosynthesis C-methylase UbiE
MNPLSELRAVPRPEVNIDAKVVEDFGREWKSFDQTSLTEAEHRDLFDNYFGIFPFESLPQGATGFDLGCGSGRWAALVAPKVGFLHCIDPASEALAVAGARLKQVPNVDCHLADVDSIPLPDSSQDFGYSLGVLHHIPDTEAALRSCVAKLKRGAPFLLYLYYRFDNRPRWFRMLWGMSDAARRVISRMPFPLKKAITDAIALSVYWPLSRTAYLAEKRGLSVESFPLSFYRNASFYTMRTDALDRFGTRLEHRFTRSEIHRMMTGAGLTDIQFSHSSPYWVAVGVKA